MGVLTFLFRVPPYFLRSGRRRNRGGTKPGLIELCLMNAVTNRKASRQVPPQTSSATTLLLIVCRCVGVRDRDRVTEGETFPPICSQFLKQETIIIIINSSNNNNNVMKMYNDTDTCSSSELMTTLTASMHKPQHCLDNNNNNNGINNKAVFVIPGINTASAWVNIDRSSLSMNDHHDDEFEAASVHSAPVMGSGHDMNDDRYRSDRSAVTLPSATATSTKTKKKKSKNKKSKKATTSNGKSDKTRKIKRNKTSNRIDPPVYDAASNGSAAVHLLRRAQVNAKALNLVW